jgi:glycosyltransferase involved in cell wall biosynthesis
VLFHPKFTVPLLCASKSVMMLHGAGWFIPEVQHFWSRTTRLYTRIMMPIYCRRAGAVLAVSEITREVFIERLGVAPDKITTLYFAPGRQFAVPPDAAQTEAVRARYALPERFILTLSGGDRAERKNFGAILEAFKRVHARRPCALVVAGRGCEEFRTRYNIPEEGWGRDVHFPGWVDQADLPVLFREAELFLYPSNMEAHPIPVTEALATGTPIVTSNAYGLKELAGDAALLVDPADPDAIADAVLKLVSDPLLREQLEAKAAERSKLFDWDVCAARTLAILERVGGGEGVIAKSADLAMTPYLLNAPLTSPLSAAHRLPLRVSRTTTRPAISGTPMNTKPSQSSGEAWRRISSIQCRARWRA